MPISRFVAVSLSPASSVRRRTLASTGKVLRLLTALLTTCRPRARFSCMTESFTSLELPSECPVCALRCRRRGDRTSDCESLFLSSHSVVIIMVLMTGKTLAGRSKWSIWQVSGGGLLEAFRRMLCGWLMSHRGQHLSETSSVHQECTELHLFDALISTRNAVRPHKWGLSSPFRSD